MAPEPDYLAWNVIPVFSLSQTHWGWKFGLPLFRRGVSSNFQFSVDESRWDYPVSCLWESPLYYVYESLAETTLYYVYESLAETTLYYVYESLAETTRPVLHMYVYFDITFWPFSQIWDTFNVLNGRSLSA